MKLLNLIVKTHMLRYLNFSFLLLSVSMSGCILNNPAHSPAIEGDIEISKDSKGDLCFMPIFSSATIMGNPTDLKHINMEYLIISDPNSTGGDRIKINIEPKNSNFFVLQAN